LNNQAASASEDFYMKVAKTAKAERGGRNLSREEPEMLQPEF
jgi:hypothetical protein